MTEVRVSSYCLHNIWSGPDSVTDRYTFTRRRSMPKSCTRSAAISPTACRPDQPSAERPIRRIWEQIWEQNAAKQPQTSGIGAEPTGRLIAIYLHFLDSADTRKSLVRSS
jgi:hypothetical protein